MSWAVLVPPAFAIAALTSCVGSGSAAPETESAVEDTAETATDTGQTIAAEATLPAPPEPAPPAVPALVEFAYSGEMTQGGYIRGRAPDTTVQASLGEQSIDIAEDGTFFAAFDRDSPGTLALSATLANGQIVRENLTISPRDWQIERVNVARRPGGASAAFMARRRPELNAIVESRAQQTGATGWSQDFIWPVKGRISGRFGRQRIYRGEPGSYHGGIDIAPGNGVPFVAPADGVVVLARTGFSLEGGLIIIDHGQGLNSAFLHASRIVVEEGQSVTQGQHIGNVGSTGRATGPHLHWGLKWKAARLDPLLFVGPMN
ncbi:peptidoglycan DD-metalloendopeptidase family protein [Erythrobacter sp. Alg231-14]|uniref:peptidoglycan DD-metalloendopeptidase family protein n=1 Tax=Erythrobacter sp. Alg231-14 TaxID=1922225 RepID=UPI000D553AD6